MKEEGRLKRLCSDRCAVAHNADVDGRGIGRVVESVAALARHWVVVEALAPGRPLLGTLQPAFLHAPPALKMPDRKFPSTTRRVSYSRIAASATLALNFGLCFIRTFFVMSVASLLR